MLVEPGKAMRYLLASVAMCTVLACSPGGPGTPGEADEQQRGRKKRDALLGPARASVLLVGTFKLHNAVILDDTFDGELSRIVEKLVEFKPTRVAVGVADQAELDERYADFVGGDYQPGASLIDQLALPVAETLGHKRVWGIDAAARETRRADLRTYALEHNQADRLNTDIVSRYDRWFQRESRYQATESIEDSLVWLNEPRRIANAHGRNLVGEFDLGEGEEYPGADALTGWYNRHLRMFAKLQRIAGNAERILVVIDASHVSLLRHSVEASPRFELIEVNEYLGVPQGAQRQVVPLL
jgi:hypothetical protein